MRSAALALFLFMTALSTSQAAALKQKSQTTRETICKSMVGEMAGSPALQRRYKDCVAGKLPTVSRRGRHAPHQAARLREKAGQSPGGTCPALPAMSSAT